MLHLLPSEHLGEKDHVIPFNNRSLLVNLNALLYNTFVSGNFKLLPIHGTSILNRSFMGEFCHFYSGQ